MAFVRARQATIICVAAAWMLAAALFAYPCGPALAAGEGTITVEFRDEGGNGPLPLGDAARVFAARSGLWVDLAYDPSTKRYRATAPPGALWVGASVDEDSGFYLPERVNREVAAVGGVDRMVTITARRAAGLLVGEVVSSDGAPLAAALIDFSSTSDSDGQPISIVARGGRFTLPLPRGERFRIRANAPQRDELVNPEIQQLAVGPRGLAGISLVFRRPDRAITGTVVRVTDGSPVAGATVLGRSASGRAASATTDGAGFFTLRVGGNDEWTVRATRQEMSGIYLASDSLAVPTGGGTARVRLTLLIRGVVPPAAQAAIFADREARLALPGGGALVLAAGSVPAGVRGIVRVTPTAALPREGTVLASPSAYEIAMETDAGARLTALAVPGRIEVPFRALTAGEAGRAKLAYWDPVVGTTRTFRDYVLDGTHRLAIGRVDRLNLLAGVVVADPEEEPPPTAFSLSAASASVVQGQSVTSAITTSLDSGKSESVFFSVISNTLSAGVTTSFNPSSCALSCETTLILAAAPDTPVGSHTVTVKATGASSAATATLTLTVSALPPPPPAATVSSGGSGGGGGGSAAVAAPEVTSVSPSPPAPIPSEILDLRTQRSSVTEATVIFLTREPSLASIECDAVTVGELASVSREEVSRVSHIARITLTQARTHSCVVSARADAGGESQRTLILPAVAAAAAVPAPAVGSAPAGGGTAASQVAPPAGTAAPASAAALPLARFSPLPAGLRLRFGTTHPFLPTVQAILQALGYFPRSVAFAERFGPATLRAVQRFQARHGIVSSGNPDTTGYGALGPRTVSRINNLIEGARAAAEELR